MMTRRDCLRQGGLAAAALPAAGCVPLTRRLSQPEPPERWAESDRDSRNGEPAVEAALRRVVKRTSFGARPGDVKRIREIGIDAYLEEQLHPERLEESPAVAWRLWHLDTLQVDTDFRFEFPKEQVQAELQQAAVIRAVYSQHQLQEVMVDFWSDHFNVSQLKGDSAFFKTADDDAVIRRHALGKFRDLLAASAKSPAMLHYLDNVRNTRSALNENYGRELMELHTLGVHGGYTQRDVQEVARCFTGWSIQDERTWWHGEFVYRPEQHDDGARRVLGIDLRAGLGQKHGERVLEILANHPSTARFIAHKLCRRFVADEGSIPGALVERLTQTFQRTDGDIRQVLGVLFRSDEFRYGTSRKLKRPFDFVVSALRAVNADTDGRGILSHLRRMGQAPFQWAMPNGYPDRTEAWLPSLLGRWNFATSLASGQISGTTVDLEELVRATGAHRPHEQASALQTAILGQVEPRLNACLTTNFLNAPHSDGLAQAAALLLASPEFQWRD
jgi:uncharacterized protein (DUF1800 family)